MDTTYEENEACVNWSEWKCPKHGPLCGYDVWRFGDVVLCGKCLAEFVGPWLKENGVCEVVVGGN